MYMPQSVIPVPLRQTQGERVAMNTRSRFPLDLSKAIPTLVRPELVEG
jgi:hypothetical protein